MCVCVRARARARVCVYVCVCVCIVNTTHSCNFYLILFSSCLKWVSYLSINHNCFQFPAFLIINVMQQI